MSLPPRDLAIPALADLKQAPPSIDSTPYSGQIDELLTFFREIRDSELAERGKKDFTNGLAKKQILPVHLSLMKEYAETMR